MTKFDLKFKLALDIKHLKTMNINNSYFISQNCHVIYAPPRIALNNPHIMSHIME